MRLIISYSNSMRIRAFIATIILLSAATLRAADIEEKYDDGTPHLRYHTDFEGHKTGDFEEFGRDGILKLQGTYAADKRTGAWTTFDERGKPAEIAQWRDGTLDGPFERKFPSGRVQMRVLYRGGDYLGPITTYDQDGHILLQVSYPHPLAEVLRVWNELAPHKREAPKYTTEPKLSPPYAAGSLTEETLAAAAKYASLYRWMSGVPQADLRIDPALCGLAQHAAVLIAKLGLISHKPQQPADMDEAFFKQGYLGCSQSNLYQGRPTIFDAIDAFMADAEDYNIQKVGHRQWLLNTGLHRVGFGSVEGFTAMHIFTAEEGGSGYGTIAYPGQGYYPEQLLAADAPWSVHLNLSKAKVQTPQDVAVSLEALDDHFVEGKPWNGSMINVVVDEPAHWTVIVFRPGRRYLPAGKYLVKIDGLETPFGAALPFSYLVDLRKMPDSNPATQPSPGAQGSATKADAGSAAAPQ